MWNVDIMGSKAYAKALERCGLISSEDLKLMLSGK